MQFDFTDTRDTEAFHLPLTGLFADVDAGSGCVRLTDDFEDCDAVTQLRIIQDWQRDLRERREASLERLFRAEFAALPISRSQQIARFSRYCEKQGLDCPPEVAAGLGNSAWGYTSTTQ